MTWMLGKSTIHGRGVFAATTIPPGTDLGASHHRVRGRWNVTELGRWHNHSSEPSAKNVLLPGGRERRLVTTKALARGDEITVDYRQQPELEQPAPGWLSGYDHDGLEWLGAGPGPTKTYHVDMPFPWGDDTEIIVPVQQIVNDALDAALPRIGDLAQSAALRVAPVAVAAIDARLPEWIERAVNEVQPEARREVDRALRRLTIGFGVLAVGVGYLIFRAHAPVR